MTVPNYKRIYSDILQKKFPDKIQQCQFILRKRTLSSNDIIELNIIIFGTKKNNYQNQKYKSYDKYAIFEILKYQKKHKLNNSQIAKHFNLSRNTIASWKKYFYD